MIRFRRGRVNTQLGAGGITHLYGDVSAGPGVGSQEAFINADAITFAMLPDLEASTLLGRGSNWGMGDPEQITLGAGLTMTDRVLSSSGGAAFIWDGPLRAYIRPRPVPEF
jgi:hypothetical protein